MSVKAKAISAVQQQDGLIMAQIRRKRGMVGREASLLRGVLCSGRAEIGKGIGSASIWSCSRRKGHLILRSCLGII
jgi:hypothetical protein